MDEPVIKSYHTNSVSAGSALALTCAGNGTSPIVYSWYKNGIQVSSTTQLKIINDIKKQDGGEYTCKVSNSVGEKTSKPVNVTVICKFYSADILIKIAILTLFGLGSIFFCPLKVQEQVKISQVLLTLFFPTIRFNLYSFCCAASLVLLCCTTSVSNEAVTETVV